MKLKIVLVLAIATLIRSEPFGKCPPDEDPATPTHLPDSVSCTVFYKCLNGRPIPFDCPAGQEWNMDGPYCDFPDRAHCERPLNPSTSTTTVAPPPTTTESVNKPYGKCPAGEDPVNPTLLPDAEDCKKFYKCLYGEPFLNYCPPGLEWSLESSYCDYPDLANCQRPLGPTTSVTPPAAVESTSTSKPFADDVCENASQGDYPTFVPHESDCHKYYMCNGGHAFLYTCPAGLYFNEQLNACDFPYNVECKNP